MVNKYQNLNFIQTSRFAQENLENTKDEQLPLLKFPFISLLATGKHTEIVLNRGIGLHTVLGMTIDVAIGTCIDKAYIIFKKFENVLKDEN